MRSQNGLDRSRDQLNWKHGSSKCAVEYDEFDELLYSEVGSIVTVLLSKWKAVTSLFKTERKCVQFARKMHPRISDAKLGNQQFGSIRSSSYRWIYTRKQELNRLSPCRASKLSVHPAIPRVHLHKKTCILFSPILLLYSHIEFKHVKLNSGSKLNEHLPVCF